MFWNSEKKTFETSKKSVGEATHEHIQNSKVLFGIRCNASSYATRVWSTPYISSCNICCWKIFRSRYSKGDFGYCWEGTRSQFFRTNITAKYCPFCNHWITHICGRCWYTSRVLSQQYPTFFLWDMDIKDINIRPLLSSEQTFFRAMEKGTIEKASSLWSQVLKGHTYIYIYIYIWKKDDLIYQSNIKP